MAKTVSRAGHKLTILLSPNQKAAPGSFAVRITRNRQLLRHPNLTLTFEHTEMEMSPQEYQLTETWPRVYSRSTPALIMVGRRRRRRRHRRRRRRGSACVC